MSIPQPSAPYGGYDKQGRPCTMPSLPRLERIAGCMGVPASFLAGNEADRAVNARIMAIFPHWLFHYNNNHKKSNQLTICKQNNHKRKKNVTKQIFSV